MLLLVESVAPDLSEGGACCCGRSLFHFGFGSGGGTGRGLGRK